MKTKPAFGLLGALAVGAISLVACPDNNAPAGASIASELGVPGVEISSPPPLPDPALPPFDSAASAVRDRDCARAQGALDPLIPSSLGTDGDGSLDVRSRHALLLSGLYAHACEDVVLARQRLARAEVSQGPLEDWRLYLLADSAHATGDSRAARQSLDRLLSNHPDSPLWGKALIEAVDHALEAGDEASARSWIALGRQAGQNPGASSASLPHHRLSASSAELLETRAWEMATASGDRRAQQEAARQLLIRAPDAADRLEVLRLFTVAQGAARWSEILDDGELIERAHSLLASRRPHHALVALDSVSLAARDLDWTLLRSRALRGSGRSQEAWSLLREADRLAGDRPEAETRLAWERAQVAEDLASASRGGASSTREQRAVMDQEYRSQLARVVALDTDRERSTDALKTLFASYVDRGQFDRAVEALRVLRRVDPEDSTGAAYLWGQGWNQYQSRNHTGAIGYWSELVTLYPDRREARAGRYWTGRAFEALGNQRRAQAVYQEVADADTTDFYRRHALARLGTDPASQDLGPAKPPVRPLPADPLLERARLLSDLGLDSLALAELEALGERPTLRARQLLQGVVLSREGRYRASIPYLRRAFPALGSPGQGSVPESVLRLYYPLAFEEEVLPAARRSGLPPHLVLGMIREESAFDMTAMSRVGARGLMQVMPATGQEVAQRLSLPFSRERLDDPAYNIRLGTTYFRQVLDMFDGQVELALAGYNGGPYRMKRLWREAGPQVEPDYFLESLPIDESRNYVKRITVFADSYRQLYSDAEAEGARIRTGP